MATNVIYKAPVIKIDYENDVYSVKAKKNIPSGTILMIEHGIFESFDDVVKITQADQELFNELFPRNSEDPKKKAELNSVFYENNFFLGRMLSKFNHKCDSNCIVIMNQFNGHRIASVCTSAKIKKGDELFIDYTHGGKMNKHDLIMQAHGFTCECVFNSNGTKTNCNTYKLVPTLVQKNWHFVSNKISEYFISRMARDVIDFHKKAST